MSTYIYFIILPVVQCSYCFINIVFISYWYEICIIYCLRDPVYVEGKSLPNTTSTFIFYWTLRIIVFFTGSKVKCTVQVAEANYAIMLPNCLMDSLAHFYHILLRNRIAELLMASLVHLRNSSSRCQTVGIIWIAGS